ncbi:MAG: ligase-associated DNA damage response exonuclease [Acidobacteriota bacterium]
MTRPDDLLVPRNGGLHCPAGGFDVDPGEPAPLALITHAHSDHARPGSGRYLAAEPTVPFLRLRLGEDIDVTGVPFGETVRLGDAGVSFHPAGHILGSAQVRVEAGGEVWVVSGDYARQPDPTSEPFEVVPCDTFVTEATFALPIYRFPDPGRVAEEVLSWWDACRDDGRAAVLACYALGKSQRLLAELARITDRTVHLHGAMVQTTRLYREAGIPLLETAAVADRPDGTNFAGELILAPPSALRSPWMRRFGDARTAFASGWMRLRGPRRRRAVDRGFVLSDHADWPDLVRTVEETGARRVLVTHGFREPLARFLRERGLDAEVLATGFEGEVED